MQIISYNGHRVIKLPIDQLVLAVYDDCMSEVFWQSIFDGEHQYVFVRDIDPAECMVEIAQ